jgi:AraC family transcriptional regulator, transcriptional activator of pobA
MTTVSIRNFYNEVFGGECPELNYFLDNQQLQDVGHFNVFNIAEMYGVCSGKPPMAYNRRSYYKISLINGRNRVEYADKVLNVDQYAVLFATPKIPYRYQPQDSDQSGHFCVFTSNFITRSNAGLTLDELPIFSPQSDFVFSITEEQYTEVEGIFNKMHAEIGSDYPYKNDLLRTYLIELIHAGQKLKPFPASLPVSNASTRIFTLFVELLERQFPIEQANQVMHLKTARDFADQLALHVNHLNKVLKETTGKTTTEIIAARILQEARMLLRQTSWNVSEIAYCLGFDEVAHFSNFFKKRTATSPAAFRDHLKFANT